MPTNIKLSLSLVVALVGSGAYLLERYYGDHTVGVVAGSLTLFMIIAMWIFPEASKEEAK